MGRFKSRGTYVVYTDRRKDPIASCSTLKEAKDFARDDFRGLLKWPHIEWEDDPKNPGQIRERIYWSDGDYRIEVRYAP